MLYLWQNERRRALQCFGLGFIGENDGDAAQRRGLCLRCWHEPLLGELGQGFAGFFADEIEVGGVACAFFEGAGELLFKSREFSAALKRSQPASDFFSRPSVLMAGGRLGRKAGAWTMQAPSWTWMSRRLKGGCGSGKRPDVRISETVVPR